MVEHSTHREQIDVRFSLRYVDIRSGFLSTFEEISRAMSRRKVKRSSTGETSPLSTDSSSGRQAIRSRGLYGRTRRAILTTRTFL